MQHLDWNGLSLILEIARARSIAAAAHRLGVDQTTVSRRLTRFEKAVGISVFKRTRGGVLPTSEGERLLDAAKGMERELLCAASDTLNTQDKLTGTIRLTCVPLVAVHLIAETLKAFTEEHPLVEIALLGDSRYYRVRDREADIALRFDKPGADHRVLSRKLASVRYTICYAAGADPATLPWLGYTAEMRHLPQNAWIENAVEESDGVWSPLRVNDALEMLSFIESGAGKSYLPEFVANANPNLCFIDDVVDIPIHCRELWLLVHPSIRTLPHIDALVEKIQSDITTALNFSAD